MKVDVGQRQISLKVVYYGPPLSGKTTNLQRLYEQADSAHKGALTVLDTADERTLYFDLLPVVVESASGYTLRLKLFTVPGQVVHAATRRLVLSGADGVVFVADSRRSEARANNQFWRGMRRYLKDNDIVPDAIPTVIQFNKRDLPDVRAPEELAEIRRHSHEPIVEAVALRGEGVVQTLHALLRLLFADLSERHGFEQQIGLSADAFVAALFGGQNTGRQAASGGKR